MHRLFVAIRPPEDVRDLLIDAMDDSPALRWVGDEQLHLTLRFIGEVERPVANDIAAALDRVRSSNFQIRANSLRPRPLSKSAMTSSARIGFSAFESRRATILFSSARKATKDRSDAHWSTGGILMGEKSRLAAARARSSTR